MKEIFVKKGSVYETEVTGGEHYVDYSTYISACKAIAKQDMIIDNLTEMIKVHASSSLDSSLKQASMDFILKIAQLRGEPFKDAASE